MEQQFSVTIQPIWKMVRQLRKRVALALQDYPIELRSCAAMTASELVENAIKYGEYATQASDICFTMGVRESNLWIETVNRSTNEAGVSELLKRIDEISRSADRAALYIARLGQLLECPTGDTKLGLYRIALEGGFDLEGTYREHFVTVIATRKLAQWTADSNTKS